MTELQADDTSLYAAQPEPDQRKRSASSAVLRYTEGNYYLVSCVYVDPTADADADADLTLTLT